jgi:hypothetical protein
MISRILSGIIAAIYLVIAYATGGPASVCECFMFLLGPIALIWYSEEMGDFTGMWGSSYVSESSPGWLIALFGWLILFFPVIMPAIGHLSQKR